MSGTSTSPVRGIHHVTAIAGDAQANVDFYAGVLGLRLVKRTVNFDDPGTYHLYWGDGVGTPGTLLTFFPWALTARGRPGAGQVTTTALSVPPDSLGWWSERLHRLGVETGPRRAGEDEEALPLRDPDGLDLELVAHAAGDPRDPWREGAVPADHAVRGLAHVAITEAAAGPTLAQLTGALGFGVAADRGGRIRLEAGAGGPGARVDLVLAPSAGPGRVASGSVHHVAWRVPDEPAQRAMRERLLAAAADVTPVLDRRYFRSIYWREPGGTIFEIATDSPGFTADEPADLLGTALKLPPWLERHRAEIERVLPLLRVPGAVRA